MEVVSANDDGAVHLGGLDGSRQNTAADGDVAGEGALLVDVHTCTRFCLGEKNLREEFAMTLVVTLSLTKTGGKLAQSRLAGMLTGAGQAN